MNEIEMELVCPLTDEDILSRGRMLCRTVSEMEETERARSEAAKEFREQLAALSDRQKRLALAIQSRQETRLVGCVEQFHVPTVGRKRVIRTDTGEVVFERDMTDAEKQMNLFAGAELVPLQRPKDHSVGRKGNASQKME